MQSEPSSPPLKRRCTRQVTEGSSTVVIVPPATAKEAFELDECLILKNILLYLGNTTDVGKFMLVCKTWRSLAVEYEPLWKILLVQRYPSLSTVVEQTLLVSNPRDYFLQRLELDSDPDAPARIHARPAALRTPPSILLKQWKPTSIMFMMDIVRNNTRILSVSQSFDMDSEGCLLPYRKTEDLAGPDGSTLAFSAAFEESAGMEYQIGILQLCWLPKSYRKRGDVPLHDPIVLLAESTSFSVDDQPVAFRTDFEECSYPNPDQTWTSSHTEEVKLQMCTVWQHFASRYGISPLPFDPSVEFAISPRSIHLTNNMEGINEVNFRSDMIGVCTLQMMISFSASQDEETSWRGQILPTLISLVEDNSR